MLRASPRRSRLLTVALAVLLLVPLLLTGHAHADEVATEHCAVCTVTQHAPLVTPPAPASGDALLAATPLARVDTPPPRNAPRSVRAGRGPPAGTRRIAS